MEEDPLGVSAISSDTRRSPKAGRAHQPRLSLKETDPLMNPEPAGEYSATPRRKMASNLVSLAQHDALADGGAGSVSRRRSVNATKEHLLPYDM